MKRAGVKKGRWRYKLFQIAIGLLLLWAVYIVAVLPALLRWGATDAEYDQILPGDSLLQKTDYKNTLAITVHASPAQIWPWVAQIGLHKGGFYSYTWLENLFGCKLVNANRIHLEWQHPVVGTIEPVCASQEGKPNAGWQIAVVQERSALVWRGIGGAPWMMGVYIDSVDAHTSRLLTQQQFRYPKKWTTDWVLEKLWFEWAHCVMQHGMIEGIKKRAEHSLK